MAAELPKISAESPEIPAELPGFIFSQFFTMVASSVLVVCSNEWKHFGPWHPKSIDLILRARWLGELNCLGDRPCRWRGMRNTKTYLSSEIVL